MKRIVLCGSWEKSICLIYRFLVVKGSKVSEGFFVLGGGGNFYKYLLCVYLFTCMCSHEILHIYMAEKCLLESVLFFHHVNLRYEAQVISILGSMHFHLAQQISYLLCCFYASRI